MTNSRIPNIPSAFTLRSSLAVFAGGVMAATGCSDGNGNTTPDVVPTTTTSTSVPTTTSTTTTMSGPVDIFATGINRMEINDDGTVTANCIVSKEQSVELRGTDKEVSAECEALVRG